MKEFLIGDRFRTFLIAFGVINAVSLLFSGNIVGALAVTATYSGITITDFLGDRASVFLKMRENTGHLLCAGVSFIPLCAYALATKYSGFGAFGLVVAAVSIGFALYADRKLKNAEKIAQQSE